MAEEELKLTTRPKFRGCILSDVVGLGKSLTALVAALELREELPVGHLPTSRPCSCRVSERVHLPVGGWADAPLEARAPPEVSHTRPQGVSPRRPEGIRRGDMFTLLCSGAAPGQGRGGVSTPHCLRLRLGDACWPTEKI